jgi:hypothetical protein
MKLPNVSSKFGAPMGRCNMLPDDPTLPCKLNLVCLRWVDGDYDEGGAYWGGPVNNDPITHIYWAYGDAGEVTAQVFVRASNRQEAKTKVLEKLPKAKFYC